MTRKRKKSWIVKMRQTVIIECFVDATTEESARDLASTFEYDDPRELECLDWLILSVEENV